MPIINPNAMITLGAPLPSDPTKMVPLQLPLDPSQQGVRRFSPEELGLAIWVLTATALGLCQQIDRLERLMAMLAPEPITGLGGMATPEMREAYVLGAQLRKEVGARRELEAKAAPERAVAGGVQ